MFHVKANGATGKCTAMAGRCPFSAEGAKHFQTLAGAQDHVAKLLEISAGGPLGNASHSRPPAQVSSWGRNGDQVTFQLTSPGGTVSHAVDFDDLADFAKANPEVRKTLAKVLAAGDEVYAFPSVQKMSEKQKATRPNGVFLRVATRRMYVGGQTLFVAGIFPANDTVPEAAYWEKAVCAVKYFGSLYDAEDENDNLVAIYKSYLDESLALDVEELEMRTA
jgi:hypothetical protein